MTDYQQQVRSLRQDGAAYRHPHERWADVVRADEAALAAAPVRAAVLKRLRLTR